MMGARTWKELKEWEKGEKGKNKGLDKAFPLSKKEITKSLESQIVTLN